MACKPGLICGRAAIAVLGLTVLAAPPETGLSAKIDSIFSSLAGKKTPGLAVLARRGGRTMFERGYGVRELRTFATIDSGTDFRLASCTKQFTAMAVMLLVHDGALRYDRTLTELFPEFPEYGRGITIRHLLTHTSGLPDYEELMEQADKAGAGNWSTSNQIHDADVLRLIERQKAGKFAPGTSWAYSNSGYVLLGLIVAKASGEPFERFLHDRIFQLLHMDHTIAFVAGENSVPDRAYGHVKAAEGFRESDQSSTSATLGDGGVYSNLADLAKWDEALEKHSLLSEREMQPALDPVRLANAAQPKWPRDPGDDNLAPGKPVSYGFGWFLDPWQAHARMWHFGSTMGFRTAIERFTRDGLTVIVLSNRTDLDPGGLAEQVADAVLKQSGTVR